jgi:hypothetical protein
MSTQFNVTILKSYQNRTYNACKKAPASAILESGAANTKSINLREERKMKRFCMRAVFFLVAGVWSVAALAQSADFSIALSPAVVTLPQGAVTSFNLTFDSAEKPSFTVNLAGLPDGVQAETGLVHGGTSTVVLYANADAALGTFAVQVIARSGKISQTQILTLNIRPMLPVPQWEYKMVTANTDVDFIAWANNLGDQGWELVNVRFQEVTAPLFVGFFKRIKR